MRYIYLIILLAVEALAIWAAKEHTSSIQPFFIVLLFLAFGVTMKVLSRREYPQFKSLSWGLFYGSIIHLVIGIGFIVYVLFLFRNISD